MRAKQAAGDKPAGVRHGQDHGEKSAEGAPAQFRANRESSHRSAAARAARTSEYRLAQVSSGVDRLRVRASRREAS
jgi:hypothetical protein